MTEVLKHVSIGIGLVSTVIGLSCLVLWALSHVAAKLTSFFRGDRIRVEGCNVESYNSGITTRSYSIEEFNHIHVKVTWQRGITIHRIYDLLSSELKIRSSANKRRAYLRAVIEYLRTDNNATSVFESVDGTCDNVYFLLSNGYAAHIDFDTCVTLCTTAQADRNCPDGTYVKVKTKHMKLFGAGYFSSEAMDALGKPVAFVKSRMFIRHIGRNLAAF